MSEGVKAMYLVVRTWDEGIEDLCYLTASSVDAVKNKIAFAQRALEKERKLYNELKINSKGPDPDPREVSDMFCIQRWDGAKFKCVCAELRVAPSRRRLR